jgi:hypothetical protein
VEHRVGPSVHTRKTLLLRTSNGVFDESEGVENSVVDSNDNDDNNNIPSITGTATRRSDNIYERSIESSHP